MARESLDCAIAERPDDWATFYERSRFLFEHSTTDEADEALQALLARRPDDASAHHNRGIVLMKSGRLDEAVAAYEESLRYRLTYAGTYLNLGYALRDTGRPNEAREAWEQAARLAPNDRTAREELSRTDNCGRWRMAEFIARGGRPGAAQYSASLAILPDFSITPNVPVTARSPSGKDCARA